MTVGASRVDRDLVERMLSGEQAAFDEFFASYFPVLHRFALARLARDVDAADEVTQSALCKIVRNLESYRGEASLLTWMCTFCRHEISAWYRKRSREVHEADLPHESSEVRAALDSLAMEATGPFDEAQRREIAGLVRAVLDCLPRQYGMALEWKYLDDRTAAEIADRLDMGLKAAESLLVRARRAFRDAFSAVCRGPDGLVVFDSGKG